MIVGVLTANELHELLRATALHSTHFCMVLSAGQLPRGVYTRLMLSVNGVCESCWESNGNIMCGMTMWDGQLSNHTYRLLFKHGVSPSSATLRECQTNQMPGRSYQLPPPKENWGRP